MSEKTAAYWFQRIAEDVAELGHVDPDRYEVWHPGGYWFAPNSKQTLLTSMERHPEKVRHAPRRIEISGQGGTFSYPEPMRKEPENGSIYWTLSFGTSEGVIPHQWEGRHADHKRLRRGRAHANREAAIEHAEAEIRAAGFEP